MTRKCDMYFTMERKLQLFLSCSLKIYDVPAEERERVLEKVCPWIPAILMIASLGSGAAILRRCR